MAIRFYFEELNRNVVHSPAQYNCRRKTRNHRHAKRTLRPIYADLIRRCPHAEIRCNNPMRVSWPYAANRSISTELVPQDETGSSS
jgi:hypothetical protein